MSQNSGFFTANVINGQYDRTYTAEEFAKYFSMFIGNGIFPGDEDKKLAVIPIGGMRLKVNKGKAWINGYWYENTSDETFELNPAHGIYDRIDVVALRLSIPDRSIKLVIKEGIPGASPEMPTIKRDADAYELYLATIYVTWNCTEIKSSMITDRRLDSSLCGIVGALVSQWDVSDYGLQLNNFISDYVTKSNNEYESFSQQLEEDLDLFKNKNQTVFNEWLKSLEVAISQDEAKSVTATVGRLISSKFTHSTVLDWALSAIDGEKRYVDKTSTLGSNDSILYYTKGKDYEGIYSIEGVSENIKILKYTSSLYNNEYVAKLDLKNNLFDGWEKTVQTHSAVGYTGIALDVSEADKEVEGSLANRMSQIYQVVPIYNDTIEKDQQTENTLVIRGVSSGWDYYCVTGKLGNKGPSISTGWIKKDDIAELETTQLDSITNRFGIFKRQVSLRSAVNAAHLMIYNGSFVDLNYGTVPSNLNNNMLYGIVVKEILVMRKVYE